MRGRSSSPGPLLRHSRSREDRNDAGDEGRKNRHRHRPRSHERSGHRHHHRHRRHSHSHSRPNSPIDAPLYRGRSRSNSPRRRRKDSRSPHAHLKRRRSRSTTSSSSSGSDEDMKRHKSHHRKHKHKHRRSSHSRERREKKKARKEKRKGKASATSEWGRYGIISETDLYNKEEEFRAWLIEEKMVNRETLSKDQEKKLFSQFVEDYNTATLPHQKYYNMAKYEAHMNLLRNGELVPQSSDYDAIADFQAHAASHKRSSVQHETHLTKDQLAALRKVQNERTEVGKMKVLGLEVKNSMGVRMDGNEFEPGRR